MQELDIYFSCCYESIFFLHDMQSLKLHEPISLVYSYREFLRNICYVFFFILRYCTTIGVYRHFYFVLVANLLEFSNLIVL